MTRIVCMSDTHNWIIKQEDIPEGDILIHAGDATGEGDFAEVVRFAKWFGDIKGFKHKIFIPGNHDFLFETQWGLAKSLFPDDVIILNDSGVELEGLKFWGSPVTPFFFNWAFNRRGDEIDAHWDMIPHDTNVLITHGPPFNILDIMIRGEHVGDPRILKYLPRLTELQLHVFGHIHWSNGVEKLGNVTFVNASVCDEQYKPTQKINVVEI